MKPAQTNDERFTIWSAARAEANLAYQAWYDRRGAEAYAVYRADAAEQALVFAVRPLLTA